MTEPRTILLVEDDQKDIQLAMAAFGECEKTLRVVVADDGEDALDYLTYRGRHADRIRGDPAVVLLDINMPRMNGMEVLRRLRTVEALRFLPVVFLSSSRDPGDVSQGYKLGANGYVVKPSKFKQFKDAVRQISAFWTEYNETPANPQHSDAGHAPDSLSDTPFPKGRLRPAP